MGSGKFVVNGTLITSKEVAVKVTGARLLTPKDIANSMMQSFEYDKVHSDVNLVKCN
jgi:hypothetical protein